MNKKYFEPNPEEQQTVGMPHTGIAAGGRGEKDLFTTTVLHTDVQSTGV